MSGGNSPRPGWTVGAIPIAGPNRTTTIVPGWVNGTFGVDALLRINEAEKSPAFAVTHLRTGGSLFATNLNLAPLMTLLDQLAAAADWAFDDPQDLPKSAAAAARRMLDAAGPNDFFRSNQTARWADLAPETVQ